jgi:ankyrin repeat protein
VAVKYKNNLGYTPLHLAAKLGNLPVCEVLLGAGARADLKDQVCCCTVMQPCACSHTSIGMLRPSLLVLEGCPLAPLWCRLDGQRFVSFPLQRGKLPADLVPRVGNHNELLELLSAAAAEKGGGGASAMGGLSPSVPPQRSASASPAPHPALSPGLTQAEL